MPGVPTSADQTKIIDARVQKAMRGVRMVLASVVSYTGGTGIVIKFAEDANASTATYQILGSYTTQKPVAGDKVLVARVPQDDGSFSSIVQGPVIPPPTTSGQAQITGEVRWVAFASIPAGWLAADGTAVSRTIYADLFAAIGTAYGVGDGSTTFNVPNLNGKVLVGVGDAGSSFAGHTNHTLGQAAGEETHVLSINELAGHTHTGPAHTHSFNDPNNVTAGAGAESTTGNAFSNAAGGNTGSAGTGATGSTGGTLAHNNMMPYLALTPIIKT